MKSSDLRILRSKKMIKEAFLELITEKDYQNVTIKDIAERAMINRKTFYNRYESVDALFQEILHENISSLLQSSCRDFDGDITPGSLPHNIRAFLGNLSLNKEVLQILLNHVSVYVLDRQIEKCLQSHFREKAAAEGGNQCPGNNCPPTLLSGLTASFYMVLAKWWLTQQEYSEEQAATIVEDIINNGFPGLLII